MPARSSRFWNVRPIPILMTSCEGRFSTELPSNSIEPSAGSQNREMQLNTVDLPAPFGPIRAWIAPFATSIEKSFNAQRPPKRTVRFLMERIALMTPAAELSQRLSPALGCVQKMSEPRPKGRAA